MNWQTEAPSNIALIKYMGKGEGNLPANASLSWTLDHLVSRVELELWDRPYDEWQPLSAPGFQALELSDGGKKKFLDHLRRMKELHLFQGHFLVRSGNNFPADAGIASSASSFAALTRAAHLALSQLSQRDPNIVPVKDLARISRHGSGSSCRSFFPGWVRWQGELVEPVPLVPERVLHQLCVVAAAKKEVSSSEAHRRVRTSALFAGRVARAEARLVELEECLRSPVGWSRAFEIVWAESWDMHGLFLTSSPPFNYVLPGSIQVMEWARSLWKQRGRGPLVTMDAGANVHLLWRPEDRDLLLERLPELQQYGPVLGSW